jgi:hypothetical protein
MGLFIRHIIKNLLTNRSSLLILAPGLCERLIVNYLIRIYATSKNLVFFLPMNSGDFDYQIVEGEQYPKTITSEYDSVERADLFRKGGGFFFVVIGCL